MVVLSLTWLAGGRVQARGATPAPPSASPQAGIQAPRLEQVAAERERPERRADLEKRWEEKAALVAEDLRRAPRNVALLQAAIQCNLARAVLERERHGGSGKVWLDAAARHVDTLRPEMPVLAAIQEVRVRHPERLEWTEPADPSNTGQSLRLYGFHWSGARELESPPILSAAPPPGAMSGGRTVVRGAAPPSSRAPGYPGSRRAFLLADRRAKLDVYLRELRARFQNAPDDVDLAHELGLALEDRSRMEQTETRSDPTAEATLLSAGQRYLDEAVEVYETAARSTPLRVHKAAFYKAQADVYAKLQRWDLQSHMLTKALRQSPTSARVWRELSEVRLILGRPRESTDARRLAAAWTLPELRPR